MLQGGAVNLQPEDHRPFSQSGRLMRSAIPRSTTGILSGSLDSLSHIPHCCPRDNPPDLRLVYVSLDVFRAHAHKHRQREMCWNLMMRPLRMAVCPGTVRMPKGYPHTSTEPVYSVGDNEGRVAGSCVITELTDLSRVVLRIL